LQHKNVAKSYVCKKGIDLLPITEALGH